MKQALRILAVLLFLAPIVASGQDFEVVGLTSGKIAVTKEVTTEFDTTGVVIKNISSGSITVQCAFDEDWFSVFGVSHDITSVSISVGQSRTLKIKYRKFGNCGIFRANLSLISNTSTQIIIYEANIDCDLMKDKVYGMSIWRTNVGSQDSVPMWATNTTNNVINVYDLSDSYTDSETGFQFTRFIPIPYVVLPGEKIKIGQVYFNPTKPNIDLVGNSHFQSSSNTDGFGFDIKSNIFIDTNLSKPCLVITQEKPIIGPILFGGDVEHTLLFKSNRNYSQVLIGGVFLGGDGLLFSMVKPLPDTIPPLSLTPIKVRFSPTLQSAIIKDRFASNFKFNTSCGEFLIDLSALAMLPTADSIATPLFPDKEYVLGMSSSAPSSSQDFHFVNNGLTNTKIVSVGLADPSPEFVVTNITPTNTLPFTLLPGEKMTVSVLFTPSQVGKVYFNQLVITTEQGIQSVSYPLQGLRTTTSGVQESSDTSVAMMLTPNPAKSVVTVAIKGAGLLESAVMVDELGKEIYTIPHSGQHEWKWNLPADRVPSGNYFIRVTGKTPDGKPFVATKRLVVQ